LQARGENDLAPLSTGRIPSELLPLLSGTNQVMGRLARLLEHQKRFFRDAAHQLRTPLAVLKTQVQSALRGDVPAEQALREIGGTVDRATELANQMLALAKVEQLRQQDDAPVSDFAAIVRTVALDLAPLMAQRQLDFSIETEPAAVRAHEWALRELTRNLLHNAIRHCPESTPLSVTLRTGAGSTVLTIADSGPGLRVDLRERLFQPFVSGSAQGDAHSGSGLGLAICHEIVASLGGSIRLVDRATHAGAAGLDATVRLKLAENPA
jgi:two-component system sensor histidine kinase TctE